VPSLPLNLLPDTVAFRDYSTDETSAQVYPFRFEPLVLTCAITTPSFAIADADVVTGVNNLRLLTDFAFGAANKSFRIDLEIRDKTLFMARWESDISNLARTSRCRGYGRGFEEVLTQLSDIDPPQTSHHRIVSYKLGGLRTIVQYQADACDCQCEGAGSDWGTNKSARSSDAMSTTSSDRLQIIRGGTPHTLSCLVEIKSRESRKHDLQDIFPQLWLSQQSTMILGRQSRGHFTIIESGDMGRRIQAWEECHGHQLEGFATLLADLHCMVRTAASENHERRFSLLFCHDQDADTLQLFARRAGQEMLPPEDLNAE